MLWGFEYENFLMISIQLNIKTPIKFQIFQINLTYQNPNNSEQWRSFENMNFTIWNILNSSYTFSENINFNFDFTSKSEFSSYENHLSNFNLDKLDYEG